MALPGTGEADRRARPCLQRHVSAPKRSADIPSFPSSIVRPMKTWMRRRGDRVKITNGRYAGHQGTVESNVYQKTVDWSEDFYDGLVVQFNGSSSEGNRLSFATTWKSPL